MVPALALSDAATAFVAHKWGQYGHGQQQQTHFGLSKEEYQEEDNEPESGVALRASGSANTSMSASSQQSLFSGIEGRRAGSASLADVCWLRNDTY